MNSQDIVIEELDRRVITRIAPSKIHGVGLFALRNLVKGRKMYLDDMPRLYRLPYASFGKLLPHVRELLLERWPQVVNGSAFMYPDARYQAYCNHSDDPNYDAVNDVLSKDVQADDEIIEDYRKIENWEKVHVWLKNMIE